MSKYTYYKIKHRETGYFTNYSGKLVGDYIDREFEAVYNNISGAKEELEMLEDSSEPSHYDIIKFTVTEEVVK